MNQNTYGSVLLRNTKAFPSPCALKLHLSLNLDGLGDDDLAALKKHGKVKEGITRDVIVPAGISLHALHYVIQRLFGWEDAHMHHFAFPEEVFSRLTDNRLARWFRLCGVYFRFPDEEGFDLYAGEDEYDGSIELKTWMRQQYRGPYIYLGISDFYLENQHSVREFLREVPSFEVVPSFIDYIAGGGKKGKNQTVRTESATLAEFRNSLQPEAPIESLLESRSILDYLCLPNGNPLSDDELEDQISSLEENLDSLLERWNEIAEAEEGDEEAFAALAHETTIRRCPQSTSLIYTYDYGDDWQVDITCTEVYYESDIEGDEAVKKAAVGLMPVCTAADGLPVMDDVGGIAGYIDFLVTLRESLTPEKKQDLMEWVKSLGWTGRAVMPKNML